MRISVAEETERVATRMHQGSCWARAGLLLASFFTCHAAHRCSATIASQPASHSQPGSSELVSDTEQRKSKGADTRHSIPSVAGLRSK